MDMIAPFAKTGLISAEMNLWLAIPIGVLFGFALQSAGLTDGRKIGRAFYFQDTDVPIVMFSAIVTGMLGLWVLSLVGFLDISQVYLVPTFLAPVMVGGVLFGFGMVAGGYCPGTALAAVVTGKLDALMFLIGVVIGSLVFGNFYEVWEEFYQSDYRGVWRLDQVLGTTLGMTILVVAAAAIAVSVLLRLVQRSVWQNVAQNPSRVLRVIQYAIVGLALLTATGLAFFPNSAFYPAEEDEDAYSLGVKTTPAPDWRS